MNIGDRMKAYEKSYDLSIISRVPVIVRVDGKGFSRWTKMVHAKKPFDADLSDMMSGAMIHAASSIEGCLFGYTQSDEMTFVLRNDQSLESTPWFGNRLQKICSVVSSIVTASFNRGMTVIPRWGGYDIESDPPALKIPPLAYFDARVFAVPNVQEAINSIIWRQDDATKNSISAATYYEVAEKIGKKTARKKMHGLNKKQQQELLFQETGINWNDYPTKFKRGIGCYKVTKEMALDGNTFMRNSWELDEELPVFAREQEFLRNILGTEEENSIEQSQYLERDEQCKSFSELTTK